MIIQSCDENKSNYKEENQLRDLTDKINNAHNTNDSKQNETKKSMDSELNGEIGPKLNEFNNNMKASQNIDCNMESGFKRIVDEDECEEVDTKIAGRLKPL